MVKASKKKGTKTWLKVILTILILAIIGSVIYVYFTYRSQQQEAETLKNLETVAYTKGSLSASISGTGTVRANQLAVLSWSTSGTVGDVDVFLGQKVAQDDVLMNLDEANLPVEILQAQIDVTTIERSLNDLYENNSLELAQAEFDLIKARQGLEDAKEDRRVMNFGRCTDERIADLQEDYDEALDAHKRWATDATLNAVDIALANLNFCKAEFTDEEIEEADARVNLAKEKLTSLTTRIASLKDGPDPDDVTVLETQLTMAKARLAKKTITAPFNSTVTGIYALEGDQISAGVKAVQLADLSKLYIDVQISEVDIPLVKLGQNVEMVFDAYFEETYHGLVVEISPTGSENQGVVTYNVTVILMDGLDKIKSGMTAAINIITEEKSDVFVIPNAALTTVDGKDTVYVMRNGIPVAVDVVVGAYSDNSIEIVEADIEEGEIIVINPPISILSIMENNNRLPAFLGDR
jgi:RND family efflux transporter MFP subunit